MIPLKAKEQLHKRIVQSILCTQVVIPQGPGTTDPRIIASSWQTLHVPQKNSISNSHNHHSLASPPLTSIISAQSLSRQSARERNSPKMMFFGFGNLIYSESTTRRKPVATVQPRGFEREREREQSQLTHITQFASCS